MEYEGADAFDACTANKVFRCLVEFIEPQTKKSVVQLWTLKEDASSSFGNQTNGVDGTTSVNEDLISRGFAILNKKAKSDIMEVLKRAETNARKAHLNVWRHGDIDEDSDAERDFPAIAARR